MKRNYIMMMEAGREAKFHAHIDNRLDPVLGGGMRGCGKRPNTSGKAC